MLTNNLTEDFFEDTDISLGIICWRKGIHSTSFIVFCSNEKNDLEFIPPMLHSCPAQPIPQVDSIEGEKYFITVSFAEFFYEGKIDGGKAINICSEQFKKLLTHVTQ